MNPSHYTRIRDFLDETEGATAIEYGLIVSLIFLVIVVAVNAFAGAMTTMFGVISTAMASAL
jgi:pilus assembly protein Flp/PilA